MLMIFILMLIMLMMIVLMIILLMVNMLMIIMIMTILLMLVISQSKSKTPQKIGSGVVIVTITALLSLTSVVTLVVNQVSDQSKHLKSQLNIARKTEYCFSNF